MTSAEDCSYCTRDINISIPAFPSAQGFGKNSIGGRGGEILFVSNLNDAGPGSLRAALSHQNPRTVIFKTSGVIELEKDIAITSPFVTLAGQSANGDGICLKNAGLIINTHDVIIRHVRIRPGDEVTGTEPDVRDAITIIGGHNIILDHLSLSWGIDETVSIWPDTEFPTNITIQWSIISEGLHNSLHVSGPHSKGLLIGDGVKNVTVHHNLLAHNDDRNPRLKGGTRADVVNNIIYNWGCCSAGASLGLSKFNNFDPIEANVIGNYFKAGPDSKGSFFTPTNLSESIVPSSIYLDSNSGNDSLLLLFNSNPGALLNQYCYLATAPPYLPSISDQDIGGVFNAILDNVGATVPKRDILDARIADDVKYGTGHIIDSQNQVGGWPEYRSAPLAPDRDEDGIPDQWEISRGLDPNSIMDVNQDDDGDGYTNIEEYLNELGNG